MSRHMKMKNLQCEDDELLFEDGIPMGLSEQKLDDHRIISPFQSPLKAAAITETSYELNPSSVYVNDHDKPTTYESHLYAVPTQSSQVVSDTAFRMPRQIRSLDNFISRKSQPTCNNLSRYDQENVNPNCLHSSPVTFAHLDSCENYTSKSTLPKLTEFENSSYIPSYLQIPLTPNFARTPSRPVLPSSSTFENESGLLYNTREPYIARLENHSCRSPQNFATQNCIPPYSTLSMKRSFDEHNCLPSNLLLPSHQNFVRHNRNVRRSVLSLSSSVAGRNDHPAKPHAFSESKFCEHPAKSMLHSDPSVFSDSDPCENGPVVRSNLSPHFLDSSDSNGDTSTSHKHYKGPMPIRHMPYKLSKPRPNARISNHFGTINQNPRFSMPKDWRNVIDLKVENQTQKVPLGDPMSGDVPKSFWSGRELDKLDGLASAYLSWDAIAEKLAGRTKESAKNKWYAVHSQDAEDDETKLWDSSEDELLKSLRSIYSGDLKLIAKRMNRSVMDIRSRYDSIIETMSDFDEYEVDDKENNAEYVTTENESICIEESDEIDGEEEHEFTEKMVTRRELSVDMDDTEMKQDGRDGFKPDIDEASEWNADIKNVELSEKLGGSEELEDGELQDIREHDDDKSMRYYTPADSDKDIAEKSKSRSVVDFKKELKEIKSSRVSRMKKRTEKDGFPSNTPRSTTKKKITDPFTFADNEARMVKASSEKDLNGKEIAEWTPEEEKSLKLFVDLYPNDWNAVAEGMPGRRKTEVMQKYKELTMGFMHAIDDSDKKERETRFNLRSGRRVRRSNRTAKKKV